MVVEIKSKNILFKDGLKPGSVFFENGVIVSNKKADKVIDTGDSYVFPGLIDIHTHGAVDVDFTYDDKKAIIKAVKFMASHGVTSVLPTITSSTKENILLALKNIKEAMEDEEYGKCILGAHLEGPYFSLAQSGAQDKSLITEPIKEDYEDIVKQYGDIIVRWDYAPERDVNCEFVKYLKAHNIIPAVGHSDAKYDDMVKARENGCNLITHFYSCTSTITRNQGYRILGINECGYLWDDMYIEIIADGKHLPIELVQMIVKLKPNDKIILITDSLKAAGSNSIYSNVGTTKCIVDDGVCKLLDKTAFAGSIATGDRLIKTLLSAGAKIEDAAKMGSYNPATLLNVKAGQLKEGYPADIVITDKDFNIKTVFAKGNEVKA